MALTSMSDYVEMLVFFTCFYLLFRFVVCFLDDPCLPLVISDDVSVVVPLQSSNTCCGSNYSLLVIDEPRFYTYGNMDYVWNYVSLLYSYKVLITLDSTVVSFIYKKAFIRLSNLTESLGRNKIPKSNTTRSRKQAVLPDSVG
jgi:hypothetical protein